MTTQVRDVSYLRLELDGRQREAAATARARGDDREGGLAALGTFEMFRKMHRKLAT